MAQIDKNGIASGSVIYPEHVLRPIEALRGEAGYDFILSGSLIVSASTVQIKTLLPNNQVSAFIGYNTSSGDLYYTTSSYTGPAGPAGPSGSQGPPGESTTVDLDITNSQVRYVAYSGSLTERVEILSTADNFTLKPWSRSSTTLTITSTSHSLANGDYVVVRNVNTDYLYTPISVINANSFTVSVPNSGATTGSMASYTPAFKISSFSQGGVTIESPSTGKAQVNSINVSTGVKSSSTFVLSMPSSINNGAGSNNTLISQNPPILQAYRLSNGTVINTAAITLNISSNFNQFNVGGLASLVNNLIRFTF